MDAPIGSAAADASVATGAASAVGVVELVVLAELSDVEDEEEVVVEDAGVDDPSDPDEVGGGVVELGVAEVVTSERSIDWKLTPDSSARCWSWTKRLA